MEVPHRLKEAVVSEVARQVQGAQEEKGYLHLVEEVLEAFHPELEVLEVDPREVEVGLDGAVGPDEAV